MENFDHLAAKYLTNEPNFPLQIVKPNQEN